MPPLKELQNSFSEFIYSNNNSALLRTVKALNEHAEERVKIYKNNVLTTLCETLKNRYPALCKLVDESFFKYAANEYIKETPPTSGNLDEYGESFIEFINDFQPAKNYPYLSDIAKLEWAQHSAYFVFDAQPINKEKLAKTSPEQLENLKFTLHPSACLICSAFPIYKIWQITQDGYDGDTNINEKGQNILVIRPQLQIQTMALEDGEYEFLSALNNAHTLGVAYEKATAANAIFDVGNAIKKFTLNGTFINFSYN